jgi:hypothetical protein
VVAPVLLDTIAPPHRLLGDKAYDTDAFRALLHELDVALVVARCRGEGRSGEANQWRAISGEEWIDRFKEVIADLNNDTERKYFITIAAEMIADHYEQMPKPGWTGAEKEALHRSLVRMRESAQRMKRMHEDNLA